jgi:hypothetical protein
MSGARSVAWERSKEQDDSLGMAGGRGGRWDLNDAGSGLRGEFREEGEPHGRCCNVTDGARECSRVDAHVRQRRSQADGMRGTARLSSHAGGGEAREMATQAAWPSGTPWNATSPLPTGLSRAPEAAQRSLRDIPPALQAPDAPIQAEQPPFLSHSLVRTATN